MLIFLAKRYNWPICHHTGATIAMFSALEAGWGLDVVIWVQSGANPFLDVLASTFAFLGSNLAYLALLPFIF